MGAKKKPLVHRPPWQPARMITWYDPGQLFRTGLRIAQASLFAENADGRTLEPLLEKQWRDDGAPSARAGARAHVYEGDGIVIDYVADAGDGFDATYAVAWLATEPGLKVRGGEIPGPGRILLFGGDQVYPTSSDEAYDTRLTKPYTLASCEATKGSADLFAIPGNHDWYDNLVSFTRLFIQRKEFGAWKLPQRRSYFALKLPQNWWLVATDVQLGSDIDDQQEAYFDAVVEEIEDDAGIILCHAEPHWVFENEAMRTGNAEPPRAKKVAELEERLHGRLGRVRALIAGDLHHYRRHTGRLASLGGSSAELITAGGGGAFLHPTHGWRDGSDPGRTAKDARLPAGIEDYRLQKAFPAPEESRRLARKNVFGFLTNNPSFLVASGALYLLVGLNYLLASRAVCRARPWECGETFVGALLSPGTLTWTLLIVAAFMLVTDTTSKVFQRVAGAAHGLVHAATAIAIPAVLARVGGNWVVGVRPANDASGAATAMAACGLVGSLVTVAVVGAVVGAIWIGVYLYVSLNVFGRHRNEAFSSIRQSTYKNFLRMEIAASGELTIHAIGVKEVPREWAPAPRDPAEAAVPARPRPAGGTIDPELIDRVTLQKPVPATPR